MGLARGPEARDVAKIEEGGGKDGERELMEEAAGDHGLYNLARGSAWQMEGAPTPYQTRWAVRGVTGPLDRMA